jgi:hypothetical protein
LSDEMDYLTSATEQDEESKLQLKTVKSLYNM